MRHIGVIVIEISIDSKVFLRLGMNVGFEKREIRDGVWS